MQGNNIDKGHSQLAAFKTVNKMHECLINYGIEKKKEKKLTMFISALLSERHTFMSIK